VTFFGCELFNVQELTLKKLSSILSFCNCTWQCRKIRGLIQRMFDERTHISSRAFVQAGIHLPIQTHARTSNFEFRIDAKSRHDIFTNIRPSANLIAKVCCRPGIKIAMSLREASVMDKKIAIDFVASAGCYEGYQRVTFARQILPRRNDSIKGCLRKIGDVRKPRIERKLE